MNRPRLRGWACGWPCLWALLAVAAPAWAGDASPAGNATVQARVLDLRGGELRIELPEAPPARRRMLQAWVDEVAAGIPATFGRWPLERAWVRIVEIDSRDRSPVPWGQTQRGGASPGVLLYVREDAGLAELRGDWTATHEFAHLFHPYLGREGRWLAEGLASYYQNVVRARAGMMAPREAWRELDAGFRRGERDTRAGPLASAARGETMRVYWAGAAFWLEADLALRRHGQALEGVLAAHAACCLATAPARDPGGFIAALDRIAGTSLLAPLYRRHAAARAFPSLAGSYATLGLRREGEALVFEAAGGEARAAIMGGDAAR